MRDDISQYATRLMTKYSLTPSIYYYNRLEQLDQNYDSDRTLAVLNLANIREKNELNDINLLGYCNNLFSKATTKNKMNILFDDIIPIVKQQASGVIKFNKNGILMLFNKLKGTNSITKGDLLLHFIRKLQANIELIYDCSIEFIYVKAIECADNYKCAKNIYTEALNLGIFDNDTTMRISLLSLFKLVNDEAKFEECVKILDNIKAKEENKGSNLKLFNALLSSSPTFDRAIEIIKQNETFLDYDIFTINSLFKCILRDKRNLLEINSLNKSSENSLRIEQIRKKYNILPDSSYLSNFYTILLSYKSRREGTPAPDMIINLIEDIKKEGTIIFNHIIESQEIRAMSLDQIILKAESIFNDMNNDVAKNSDLITALIKATIIHNNKKLYDIVKNIISVQDRIINRSIHFHCSLTVMWIKYNKYGEANNIDIEALKADINNALKDLGDNFKPLFDKDIDIFNAVINQLTFDDAKKIVEYAKKLSIRHSNNYEFSKLFRSTHIVNLCKRIDGCEENSLDRLDEIQELINQNPEIRFNNLERITINRINKKISGGKVYMAYIPLVNKDRNIRHATWEHMNRNNTINRSDSYDIQTFIKMEVVDIIHNSWQPNKINEIYLIEALEFYSKKNTTLDSFVNESYLESRNRNEKAKYYDNFFEAFVYLRCIKPKNMYKWGELGMKFGYTIK